LIGSNLVGKRAGVDLERDDLAAFVDRVGQDTTYPSLSTIARAITGTPWNGPRFFGLRIATERNGERLLPSNITSVYYP
jgi:hypothetical protein